MKITLFGVIEAEGEPDELSMFAALFFSGMKQVQQAQEKEEMDSDAVELFRMIDESMKKDKRE